VVHIFTLDSPINGLDHTFIESLVDNHLGNSVRDFYGQLWNNLQAIDPAELAQDGGGSFRPIGTVGDYAYVLGDLRWVQTSDPNAQALLSQLLVSCGGLFGNDCSVVQPPDFVSPCTGSAYSGDASHELVRVCQPTVDYIVSNATGDEAQAMTASVVRQQASLSGGNLASVTGPILSGSGSAITAVIQAVSTGGVLHISGSGFGTRPARSSSPGPEVSARFLEQ
jgi:hypothetical protein